MKWDEIQTIDNSQPSTNTNNSGSSVKWDSIQPIQDNNPTQSPGVVDRLMAHFKGLPEAWKTDLQKLGQAQTWKDLGNDLTKPMPTPPSIQEMSNKASVMTPEQKTAANDKMTSLVMSMLPVSSMSGATRQALFKPASTASDLAKQAAIDTAATAGYSIPRSNIKQTAATNLGERFGGKQAIEATAQMKNQPVTNKLAAKALGITEDVQITPELLGGIRQEAGKAYEAIKSVGTLSADNIYKSGLDQIKSTMSGASKDFPELASNQVTKFADAMNKNSITSEGAIEMIKNLREAAKANLGPTSGAADRLLGKAQRKGADLLDDLIERNIGPVIGKEALDTYKQARKLIAKTYTVESALVGSNVSATKIAKASSKIPLTDELKQIAEFAKSFPRLSRVEMGAPPSGGLLEPLIYGGLGGMATGPGGAAASLIPIIGKPIARQLMTTIPKISREASPSVFESPLMQKTALGAGLYLQQKRKNALTGQ